MASTAAGTGAALGGKYRGVAIGASLVGVGAGETLVILAGLQAFDWVLENRDRYGIRVVSNSWGTRGSFSPDHPINVASRAAHDAGLVVVFAAGNAGPDLNTLNPFCVAPWVICVAAGHKDGRTLAEFSSRGVPGDPLYHPTLTAPGVDVAAARAKTGVVVNAFFAVDLIDLGADAVYYAVASGTSMATPHVSGTVALMLEANPGLTPDQVKALLEASATPMPGFAVHATRSRWPRSVRVLSRFGYRLDVNGVLGIGIPDLIIATVAIQNRELVFTADEDFSRMVPHVRRAAVHSVGRRWCRSGT